MVTVTVKLPPTLASQIAAAARQRRVSKSVLIRESLSGTFSNGKSSRRSSIYERTRHLAGALKGNAPRDLSSNKKYLEGLGE